MPFKNNKGLVLWLSLCGLAAHVMLHHKIQNILGGLVVWSLGRGFLGAIFLITTFLLSPWFYLSCIPSIEHLEGSAHSTWATRRWMMHVYTYIAYYLCELVDQFKR
jgi:hypothetical protein